MYVHIGSRISQVKTKTKENVIKLKRYTSAFASASYQENISHFDVVLDVVKSK